MDIQRIEKALRLHINYKGVPSNGKYLDMMDSMSYMYSRAPAQKVSKLLDDYFKAVNVSNLDGALQRLREFDNN